jgi:hypothetical protein
LQENGKTLSNSSIFDRVKKKVIITIKYNKIMSLLWSKNGFRGEYLAKYIVSKFAFISESNVSEDYGIDFYCGLIKNSINNDYVHYDKPFLLQIKTKVSQNKRYKKPNIKYWTRDKIDTVFNLNLPFFIGFLDLKQKKLDIHTTSMMWHTYLTTGIDNITRLTFKFREDENDCSEIGFPKIESVDYNKIKKNEYRGGNLKENIIDLGHPILSIDLSKIDDNTDDFIKNCIESISKCIDKENDNIMNKNLNLFYYRWVHKYITNNPDTFEFGYNFLGKEDGIDDLKPIVSINKMHHYLISLAIGFNEMGDTKNRDKVYELTRLINKDKRLENIIKIFPELYEKPKKQKP